MEIENYTPFTPFYFKHEDHEKHLFNVFLLKGSFTLTPAGLMQFSQTPLELNYTDRFSGNDTNRSLIEPSDLAPIKECTDITFSGSAVPPNSNPTETWEASARVGSHFSKYRVYGERYWRWNPVLGWLLSKPAPVSSVDFTFENCFGGTYQAKDKSYSYDSNPVGKGWRKCRQGAESKFIAHSVEFFDQPVHDPTKEFQPAGTTAVGRHWQPRTNLSGTANERWKEEQWPHLPTDFSFQFYNHAPKHLQYDGFLKGGETVEFSNINRAGLQRFILPKLDVGFICEDQNGQSLVFQMDLDSIHFEVGRLLANITWRVAFPYQAELSSIETGLRGIVGVCDAA